LLWEHNDDDEEPHSGNNVTGDFVNEEFTKWFGEVGAHSFLLTKFIVDLDAICHENCTVSPDNGKADGHGLLDRQWYLYYESAESMGYVPTSPSCIRKVMRMHSGRSGKIPGPYQGESML
jgi:hypothetical protein